MDTLATHRSVRPWLDARPDIRAELARSFDCAPCDVERCLDAREKMEAFILERREIEYPYGGRPRW